MSDDIFSRRRKAPVTPPAPAPTKLNVAADKLDELMRTKPDRDPNKKEIDRIIRLPLIRPITPEEVEAFSRENVLAEPYMRGWRLFPQQAAAVMAYDLYDGGFFPVSVGAGKTLISLMIAERAYRYGIKRSLLLLPPQVYRQLMDRDISFARQHVSISVPFFGLGVAKAKRMTLARSGRAGCYILPYSCLSTTDSSDLLDAIGAGLIIADEAHALKSPKAARTKRIRRYIDKANPQMVAMSGTITSKSISDYWHLIRSSLKELCPLPKSSHIVRQWGLVIDSDSASSGGFNQDTHEFSAGPDEFKTEPVMPLVRWAQKHYPDEDFPETIRGFRRAYKRRLNSAPGVVVSADHEIGTSLVMANEPVLGAKREGWDTLEDLTKAVRDDATAPNGDVIEHAIHEYRWLYQLSAGFYKDLYWPDATTLATERRIEVAAAVDLLDGAKWHHKLLQLYHSALRKWLGRRSKPGLDTPFLVGSSMSQHGPKEVGEELFDIWVTAKTAMFDGMPTRRSRPIRVCDYKIEAAAQWARKEVPKGKGAVIWYFHQEVGKWLAERLEELDLPVLHCPAGNAANIAVTDPKNAGRIVVASIRAHGTGKNLQHFEFQHVVQWPRSADLAEQMLGRLHRHGQKAEELIVSMCNTTETDDLNFAACLHDSCYIHESTGVKQKLMYASYSPPPVVIDPAILRRRGLDPKKLTGEQLQLLQETFGEFAESPRKTSR